MGVFYLLMNEFLLAHECFKKSQAIDPEYSAAWIGQAIIAETVEIAECIDLYGHAVELGLHVNISLHSIFIHICTYRFISLLKYERIYAYKHEYKIARVRLSI